MDQSTDCKGCRASVRIAPKEVERILAETFHGRTVARADDDLVRYRLTICLSCPDLLYGTTCRYCGCLVEVRARIADKACPAATPRWDRV